MKYFNKSSQAPREAQPSAQANPRTKVQPSTSEASEIFKENFLLDVRTPQEFQESHIPNSTLIPMQEIPNNLEKLRQIKQTILLICRSGSRAHAVQDYLEENNITNTKVLEGGILKHGTNPVLN